MQHLEAPPLFQYMSDLHLEKRSVGNLLKEDHVRAPCLVLAGDVGDPASANYVDFLVRAAELYAGGVFVIIGNHECYGKTIQQATREAEDACKRASAAATGADQRDGKKRRGVVFMAAGKTPLEVEVSGNRGEDEDEDKERRNVRVLGCTLWSHVPEAHAMVVQSLNNDCRAIRDFDIATWNALHAEEVAWLREELLLTRNRGQRCIVVTHHAPLMKGTSAPEYEIPGRALSHAFASDLSDLMGEFADVAPAWIHGHTHYSHRTLVPFSEGAERNVVLLASNQRGYSTREASAGVGFSAGVTPVGA